MQRPTVICASDFSAALEKLRLASVVTPVGGAVPAARGVSASPAASATELYFWREPASASAPAPLASPAAYRGSPSRGAARSPHSPTGEDPAITDPIASPRRVSLCVPPADSIMHPQGDVANQRRLSAALLNDEVSHAQRTLADPAAVRALLNDAIFLRACAVAGVPPTTFEPRTPPARRSGGGGGGGNGIGGISVDSGTDAVAEAEAEAEAEAQLDRIKKMALALAQLLSERQRDAEASRSAAVAAAGALRRSSPLRAPISSPSRRGHL